MVAAVDLYWLPLGAGGHCVKHNGQAYEAIVARLERRPRADLYHSALELRDDDARFVIEMTPVRRHAPPDRCVVVTGDVGARGAGRVALLRYEVHCWRNGTIPDVAEAVESPRRLSDRAADVAAIRRALETLPNPVWGRDELGTGEMWNSNSVTAWLLTRSGFDPAGIRPPARGRAPGWDAGVLVARRS